MSSTPSSGFERRPGTAEVVVGCSDLDASLAFYTGQLGFRLDMTLPADSPEVALISGYGLTLRLVLDGSPRRQRDPLRLRLPASANAGAQPDGASVRSPDGDAIEFIGPASTTQWQLRSDALLVQRCGAHDAWVSGRAGMQYRDLVPGGLGGAVIASHIRIPRGGPVPDYVHFHELGLQLIYCRRGWVRVVYEDQGPPFVMHAGDCVLQPPTIRHRVLESSAGLEVVELGSPAVHETWRDHDLQLPTASLDPQRLFRGQRFVRHVAAQARREPDDGGRVRIVDCGIAGAASGMASVRTIELAGSAQAAASVSIRADAFLFLFVLAGSPAISGNAFAPVTLHVDDACVVPSDAACTVASTAPCELLVIAMPAHRGNGGDGAEPARAAGPAPAS